MIRDKILGISFRGDVGFGKILSRLCLIRFEVPDLNPYEVIYALFLHLFPSFGTQLMALGLK